MLSRFFSIGGQGIQDIGDLFHARYFCKETIHQKRYYQKRWLCVYGARKVGPLLINSGWGYHYHNRLSGKGLETAADHVPNVHRLDACD